MPLDFLNINHFTCPFYLSFLLTETIHDVRIHHTLLKKLLGNEGKKKHCIYYA